MNAFSIKDLENLSGIKAHTIRIWEQRYSFLKPERSETNIRYYTNNDLKLVLNISLLQKFGFKISHLDKMSSDEMNVKILSLARPEARLEAIISALIVFTIEMDIAAFEAALDKQILKKGTDFTINKIIFPFYERISLLWVTAHINPAQEHLVSNIIRQKLVVGIDKISCSVKQNKTVVLFLPEYEFHELGLLYANFLFKSKGYQVLYLGANVPANDVIYVAKEKKPDLFLMHLTLIPGQVNVEKYFTNLSQSIHPTPILVSGLFTTTYKKPRPKNIIFKYSIAEVLEFILQV